MVDKLQRSLADEYLAAIQYYNGAMIVKDKAIKAELQEHASEEMRHADCLEELIKGLKGEPIKFKQARQWTACGYIRPTGGNKQIIEQNIRAERCAVEEYRQLLSKIWDSKTEELLNRILLDEYRHIYDLRKLLRRYEHAKRSFN